MRQITEKNISTDHEEFSWRVVGGVLYDELGPEPEAQGVGAVEDEPGDAHTQPQHQPLTDTLITGREQVHGVPGKRRTMLFLFHRE